MQKRRSVRNVAVAILIFALGALVALATTDRLPFVTRAWGPLASSVAAWASSSFLPQSPPTSPSAHPAADAGATHRQTAPLSSAQLAAPLAHGTFVSACGAPDNMKVVVTVAVKMGRASSVTAVTYPADPVVAACIERATRDLQWDISPKTEHVTVTY